MKPATRVRLPLLPTLAPEPDRLMRSSLAAFTFGLILIGGVSVWVYSYVSEHGYSAIFSDPDPAGFMPEKPTPDDQQAAKPEKSPPAEEAVATKTNEKRPLDKDFYKKYGKYLSKSPGRKISLFGKVAAPPIGMEHVYGGGKFTRTTIDERGRPLSSRTDRHHQRCCILMPTNDPRTSYKSIAHDKEWFLMKPKDAIRAIARRFRESPLQRVYLFQARQAKLYPKDVKRAYAVVFSDGAVFIRATSKPAAAKR